MVKQTIELLYPDHIEMIRPYLPKELIADRELQAGIGSLISFEGVRAFAKRVLRYLERNP